MTHPPPLAVGHWGPVPGESRLLAVPVQLLPQLLQGTGDVPARDRDPNPHGQLVATSTDVSVKASWSVTSSSMRKLLRAIVGKIGEIDTGSTVNGIAACAVAFDQRSKGRGKAWRVVPTGDYRPAMVLQDLARFAGGLMPRVFKRDAGRTYTKVTRATGCAWGGRACGWRWGCW